MFSPLHSLFFFLITVWLQSNNCLKAAIGDARVCLPGVSHALSTPCGDPAQNDSRIDSPGYPARAFSSGIGTGIRMTVIRDVYLGKDICHT